MVVGIFGDTELAERVRTGDIGSDLQRPLDIQSWWAAVAYGGAACQLLFRGIPPFVLGAGACRGSSGAPAGGEERARGWPSGAGQRGPRPEQRPRAGPCGLLLPLDLRSLDAVHLATAERLGDDVGDLVTYDQRRAAVASDRGHRVSAPS